MPATPLVVAALLAFPASELDRCVELLEDLDRSRISIELRDAPLESVVTEIATAAKRPVRADWDALAALGVRRDDHVDLRVTDAPVSTALSALVLQLGPEYERPIFDVGGDQVVITTV